MTLESGNQMGFAPYYQEMRGRGEVKACEIKNSIFLRETG